MTRTIILLFIFTSIVSCKKDLSGGQKNNGFFRLVVLDAPQQNPVGKVQFYLDGKINANGDSIVRSGNGTVFNDESSRNPLNSVTINYPGGGWNDNASPLTYGVNGFNDATLSAYSYFPNATHRISLAPASQGLNFYKWAAIESGVHELGIKNVQLVRLYGTNTEVQGISLYQNKYLVEANTLQTSFVVNTSPAKFYRWPTNTANVGGAVVDVLTKQELINKTSKNIAFSSDQFSVVTTKDHIDRLPSFSDTTAYIRFLNFTPVYSDETLNEQNESLDIYLAPLYGSRSNYNTNYLVQKKYTTGIGEEKLAVAGLRRFNDAVDQPFISIPVSKFITSDTAGVARYYRIVAYRAGDSKASGAKPLAFCDWLAVYNTYPDPPSLNDANGNPDQILIDSWLVRASTNHYYPTITTALIAVGQYENPSFTSDVRAQSPAGVPPLLLRSVIAFPKVGSEQDYLR